MSPKEMEFEVLQGIYGEKVATVIQTVFGEAQWNSVQKFIVNITTIQKLWWLFLSGGMEKSAKNVVWSVSDPEQLYSSLKLLPKQITKTGLV